MKRMLTMCVLVGLVGCSTDSATAEADPVEAATTTGVDDPGPRTDPEPEPWQPTARQATRMTVEQLAASIPVITGGVRWTENFGQGPVDLLVTLQATLGAPDYQLVTEENLEPSLIIAKFLQDGAARVCTKWIARDRTSDLAERTLVTHADWDSLEPGAIDANLRRLLLRVLTRHVPEDDDRGIEALRDLFLTASTAAPAGAEATDGWLAVCLALMTDPEFVIY